MRSTGMSPSVVAAFTIACATVVVCSVPPLHGAERGRLLGTQVAEHPDWFAQSFLEIAADASQAGAEGKHVMLFFDSEGCPYCYRMIEEHIKASPYTDFIRQRFHIIVLDVRGSREVAFTEALSLSESELARQLGIHFTPTLLFLDGSNRTVLRLNGYRTLEDFKLALDFVDERAYRDASLGAYLETRRRPVVYRLREHPDFAALTDLSDTGSRPLMVLFEDETCVACASLHDNILQEPQTRALLAKLTVVRLDARSTMPIVDVTGRATTPADWVRSLGVTNRPGVVMFDRGKEVFRIDAVRWRFHFQQSLRYVAERHFERVPYRDFASAHREATLASGQDVDVSE